MKRWIIYLIGVALVFAFTGCAGKSRFMSDVPASEAYYAPASGKALVVFLRPTTFGYAIQSSVHDITGNGNQFVGIVPAMKKVAYQCDPGERLFMVVGESADFMKATLLPNKVYYVVVNPRMGVWKARFSLIAARKHEENPEKFIKRLQDCKWVKNTDSAYKWAEQNAPSINKKKDEYLPKWQARPDHEMDVLLASDGFDKAL